VRSLGVAKQLKHRLAIVDDPLGQRELPVLVDHRDLRTPAVQVDADPTRSVIHGRFLADRSPASVSRPDLTLGYDPS
jgi:hypothetical protein